MLSDKIISFFFLKEEKVAFNEKNGYLKIFIHHYKNMFYIFKKKHKHHHILRNYMTFREM